MKNACFSEGNYKQYKQTVQQQTRNKLRPSLQFPTLVTPSQLLSILTYFLSNLLIRACIFMCPEGPLDGFSWKWNHFKQQQRQGYCLLFSQLCGGQWLLPMMAEVVVARMGFLLGQLHVRQS